MSKPLIFDPKLMSEIKQRALELKAAHAERDRLFDQYDEMYLINWTKATEEKLKWMQVTASPGFRDKVQGAVRLMVATDPLVNIVQNEMSKGINTEKVESFLNSVLHHSGRITGEPVHYPLITTGILYDEMHVGITSTQDQLELAKRAKADSDVDRLYKKANIARWEEITDTCAWQLDPFNPKTGYPHWGPTGLDAYYRIVSTTLGSVIDQFGQVPAGLEMSDRRTKLYLHAYYDSVFTAIWTDQGDILLKPHGLPRIPVVAQILNGSRIFEKEEDKRQPMGYVLAKTGLWSAQSLILTVMMTAVLNMGATPTKVYTPQNADDRIDISNDKDLITLSPGGRLDFVQSKGLIDPAMMNVQQLVQRMEEESTIYPQALGQAIDRQGATYSELALLAQSGRLPLIGPQRRGGWGFSTIFETIMAFMRDDARYRKNTGLDAADLAKGMEIEVKLDVALPQDKLQQANIFNILTEGDNPKVSVGWGLEHILNVNNPDKMRKEIWNEKAAMMMFAKVLQQLMQPPQPQVPPPGAGGPGAPGMPGGLPPGAAMPTGAGPAPAGMQMQGGLPQAQAGLVPGPGGPPMTPEQLAGEGGGYGPNQ